jgi:uncharacterized RmlC-like cupin family protein
VKDGKPVRLHTPGGLWGTAGVVDAIFDAYGGGATLVLQALHEAHGSLADLSRNLGNELSAMVQINAYLTPANAQGFSTHYDTHDVFILQVSGSKHWRIFESPLELPLTHQPYEAGNAVPTSLIEDVKIHTGDLIYIPRGFAHDARSTDVTSLHLTVGVHPITWAAVILSAVGAGIEGDPRFRASLPFGFARNETATARCEAEFVDFMRLLMSMADPKEAIRNAVENAAFVPQADLSGRLLDLEMASDIDLGTRVRRRSGLTGTLIRDQDRVGLRYNGKAVLMPARVEPDLQFLADVDETTPSELPGNLDDSGRLVLIRRLVREGFLTLSPRSDLDEA